MYIVKLFNLNDMDAQRILHIDTEQKSKTRMRDPHQAAAGRASRAELGRPALYTLTPDRPPLAASYVIIYKRRRRAAAAGGFL